MFYEIKFLLIGFGLNESENKPQHVLKWMIRAGTLTYQIYSMIIGIYDLTSTDTEMYYHLAVAFKKFVVMVLYMLILKKQKQLYKFQVNLISI